MSNPNDLPPAPDEVKIWLYSICYRAYEHIPLPIRNAVGSSVGLIAPDIPRSLSADLGRASVFIAGGSAAIITLLFSFVGTLGITYIKGTLYGSDPARIYFNQDCRNMFLYTCVTPAYMGFGVAIVTAVIQGYERIENLAKDISPRAGRRLRIRIPLGVFIILSLSVLFTCDYAVDVSDVEKVGKVYWYIENNSDGGHRLGFVFIYYILLNFCLLVATLTFLGVFFSMFMVSVRVGDALAYSTEISDLEFEIIRIKMGTFDTVYICAKLLIVFYMLNYYVWAATPLIAAQHNFNATWIALIIFGVFLITTASQIVETQQWCGV